MFFVRGALLTWLHQWTKRIVDPNEEAIAGLEEGNVEQLLTQLQLPFLLRHLLKSS